MSDEIKSLVESGLAGVKSQLEAAMAKYDGQIAEKAKVDNEVKAEVKTLAEDFKSLNAQLTELAQKSTDGFKAMEVAKAKTAGEEFIASEDFKSFVQTKSRNSNLRVELKNTVLSDATTTWSTRREGIIPLATLPLTLRQVIPSMPVSGNLVETMKELSWTNDAVEVAQGAAKPESDITFVKANVTIETVAHWIKVSKQMLDDAPAVASYINVRLADGLAQRIDRQLFLGDGVSPNLSGLTDTGNFTAITPVAGDNLIDAINRAKYTMWAAGFVADTVICNPAAWGAMERTREGAGTGQYLYGMPAAQAGMNPFGLNVVLSNHCPVASFFIGDLRGSTMLYNRQGTTIEVGFVGTDFTSNLVTIRAEERLALGIDRVGGLRFGAITV